MYSQHANDSMSYIQYVLENGSEGALYSSFTRYGIAFYVSLSTFDANQNFIPNLTGLLAIYCVNLYRTLNGNSCSSIVIFSPDL